jgi:hypothetical protein
MEYPEAEGTTAMSPQMIAVHSRVFGNPTPELVLQPVLVEVEAQHLKVANLIRRTVAAQITNLLARYSDDGRCPLQVLDLHYRPQPELYATRRACRYGQQPTLDLEAAQQQAL